MKQVVIAILFILLFSVNSDAQHLLIIKISGADDTKAKLTLSSWKKGKEFQFSIEDSLKRGHFTVVIPPSTKPGLLKIKFSENLPVNELSVIYKNEDLGISVDSISESQKPYISGTGETPLYYFYKNKIDSLFQRIIAFRKLLMNYGKNGSFAQKTEYFFNKEMSALDSIYSHINKIYETSLFVHFLNSDRYYIPDFNISPDEQKYEIRKHFFDFFEPLDSLLLYTPVYYSKIEDYFKLATSTSGNKEEALKNAVDKFMAKIKTAENLFEPVTSLMRTWLNQYAYDYVIEYIDITYLATQCSNENDAALQERVAAYKRLAPGNKAPEITLKNEDNTVFSLYELKAKYTIIIYWASWCPHCQVLLPEIYAYLSNKKDIKVITIGLDENEEAWKQAVKTFPLWINHRAPGKWNDELVKLYGVYATPVIFILDKDYKIVYKVKSVDELKEHTEK